MLQHLSALQAAEAAEAAKLQAAKAAALAQKQVQMKQLEQMKARILEERWVVVLAAASAGLVCLQHRVTNPSRFL